jgi:ABC-2 type transport system ATP-binding protein
MSRVALEMDGVHRHFARQPVLRGLSLSVQPGEVYALLGRNGAGKTTALRILLGFLAPHHGRSEVLGMDSQTLSPDHRRRIAYVSEGHRLYSSMRICDAVAFEAATRADFRRPEAERWIARLELPSRKQIGLLSRGQRAQLSLVLALSGEPELLVFDDPAMGLDVVVRRQLLDAMIELLSEGGCAVVFSSHILTDVERIADRVGILHEGRLIVDAKLDDLKSRVHKRLWSGAPEQIPDIPAIVAQHRHRDGQELTLLDLDSDQEARLRANGHTLGEPVVPTLEDLFLDLTVSGKPNLETVP